MQDPNITSIVTFRPKLIAVQLSSFLACKLRTPPSNGVTGLIVLYFILNLKYRKRVHDLTPVDAETRATPDDHIALRLWLRVLTCSNLIEGKVRGRLRSEFESTLPRFDLLAQLDREPDGLTMGELSKRMMVTGGNVTGLVSQLEQVGWVSRKAHPESGRTFITRLTPEGSSAFKNMAAAHEEWVKAMFEQVSNDDIDKLMDLLGALKVSVANHFQEES